MVEDEFKNEDLKTLVSCLNSLVKKGFTEDYKAPTWGLNQFRARRFIRQAKLRL